MSILQSYLKRGTYNSFFYILSSFCARALSFFFLPFLLRNFSLEEFGLLDYYQFFFSMSCLILTSCSSTSMLRFCIKYQKDPQKKQQIIGNSLLMTIIGSLLFLLIIFIIPKHSILNTDYLYITTFNIFLFSLFSIELAYLRTHEYAITYMILFLLQTTIACILTIIGIQRGYHLHAFFLSTTISILVFIPFFGYLLKHNFNFSVQLIKEQFTFSFPLLIYSIFYMGFFAIDRWYLTKAGLEQLGIYSILWRFGSIFQFITVGMSDAMPIVLFNAQEEENANSLVPQLMRIFCIVLASLGLCIIGASIVAIQFFLPAKYCYLITYLPFFFYSLIIFELARFFQMGIALANKTYYNPFIALLILAIQLGVLHLGSFFGLKGLFISNGISFLIYCFVSFKISSKYYIFMLNARFVGLILFILTLLIILFNQLIFLIQPMIAFFIIFAIWCLAVWTITISQEEQLWIKKYYKHFITKIHLRIYSKRAPQ